MKDKYKIVVAISNIDYKQQNRLNKIVEVVKNTTPIECDDLIVMHIGTKTIPKNITYKRKIQMIHGCKSIAYSDVPNADLIVPVSKAVIDSFDNGELNGLNVEPILNPVVVDKDSRKVLKLVSATRLTKEKGYKRMVALANQLKEQGIPYIWFVLTNDKSIDSNLFVRVEPTFDISSWITMCDYLVQLSDTESFCYSIVESLTLGVPVICTPIEPLEEIGVIDNKNTFIVPFDMNGIDLLKIYRTRLKFDYKGNNEEIVSKWQKILGEPKPFEKYIYKGDEIMKIKVTRNFKDSQNNNTLRIVGDVLDVARERADFIVSKGFAEYLPAPKKEEVKMEEKLVEISKDLDEIPFVPTAEEISEVEEKPKKEVAKKKTTSNKTTKKKSDK